VPAIAGVASWRQSCVQGNRPLPDVSVLGHGGIDPTTCGRSGRGSSGLAGSGRLTLGCETHARGRCSRTPAPRCDVP
jgi:hypothetical protein